MSDGRGPGAPTRATGGGTRLGSLIAWFAVVAVSASMRLGPVSRADFPLNDGGLFYGMVRDLRHAGFALPDFASYNGGEIPFTYPPLGIYLAAALNGFGVPLIDVVRFLPPIVASLTVPAFYLLSRVLLSSTAERLLATAVFGLVPGSFAWLIMGGGVTRAPGLLLGLVALYLLHRLLAADLRRPWAAAIGLGVASAATLLAHPEAAVSVAVCGLVSMTVLLRSRRVLVLLLVSGVVAAAVVAPWVLVVVRKHGWGPFEAALFSKSTTLGSSIGRLVSFNFTLEPFVAIAAVLGIFGTALLLHRGGSSGRVLAGWIVAVAILQPHFAVVMESVPLALGAGALLAVLLRTAPAAEGARRRSLPAVLLAAWCGCVLVAGALVFPTSGLVPYGPVPEADRQAFRFVSDHVPSDSPVLVVSARYAWGAGPVPEWFPALTGRVSPATPQGFEWTDSYARRAVVPAAVNSCFGRDLTCIVKAAAEHDLEFDYLYVASSALVSDTERESDVLVRSADAAPCLESVYDDGGVHLYRVVSPCEAAG